MNEAAKVVNIVEWIEMQFDFIELFWTTYGFLFQQIWKIWNKKCAPGEARTHNLRISLMSISTAR